MTKSGPGRRRFAGGESETMLIELDHRLSYEYERPVLLSRQVIRLRPRGAVSGYALEIEPNVPVRWVIGDRNAWSAVVNPLATDRLRIRSGFVAEITDGIFHHVPAPLMDLCREVHDKVRYADRGTTSIVVQEPAETLRLGTGTCRDMAWLLVDVLRRRGHDARFASGYHVRVSPVVSAELHAWVEVDDRGRWIGLDPTLRSPAGGCHVPVASADHWGDAASVSGGVEPAAEVEFSWEIACRCVEGAQAVGSPAETGRDAAQRRRPVGGSG